MIHLSNAIFCVTMILNVPGSLRLIQRQRLLWFLFLFP